MVRYELLPPAVLAHPWLIFQFSLWFMKLTNIFAFCFSSSKIAAPALMHSLTDPTLVHIDVDPISRLLFGNTRGCVVGQWLNVFAFWWIDLIGPSDWIWMGMFLQMICAFSRSGVRHCCFNNHHGIGTYDEHWFRGDRGRHGHRRIFPFLIEGCFRCLPFSL